MTALPLMVAVHLGEDVEGSISRWIHQLRAGDGEAAQRLWERYSKRILLLARRWVKSAKMTVSYDEDDVAQSAYHALCKGMQEGAYPEVLNRDSLWPLLAIITIRKSNDHLKREMAQKRSDPDLPTLSGDGFLRDIHSPHPSPDMAMMMLERCHELLVELKDADLERLVLLKLDGFTNQEVADQMGYSRRTIQRMLNIIKEIWGDHAR